MARRTRFAATSTILLALWVTPSAGSGGGETETKPLDAPVGPAPATSKEPPTAEGRFWLSAEEIVRMRENVRREPWARIAWLKTKELADQALRRTPNAVQPRDFRTGDDNDRQCEGNDNPGWYCGLYLPGYKDGRAAYSLALVYAVTGDKRYAAKARKYLLAWAETYTPAPPPGWAGHMIAEPVGFMLKGFFAYDLVRDTFSEQERRTFQDWALQFVERGKGRADSAIDHAWGPAAPWGNSATWARSLGITAAAVIGGETLRETLEWNWEHMTKGGNPYGWFPLLEGAMHPSGRMVEENYRESIDYALYTWHPLAIIANVARVTGYHRDLWTATAPTGQSLRQAIEYYAPYLIREEDSPYDYDRERGLDVMTAEYRTVMETARRRFPDWPLVRTIVEYGGPDQRGLNEDQHITGFNALTGVG